MNRKDQKLNVLVIIGDKGSYNFLFPIYKRLKELGHKTICGINQKLFCHLQEKKLYQKDFFKLNGTFFEKFLKKETIPFDLALVSVSRDGDMEKKAIALAFEKGIHTYGIVDTWDYFESRFSDVEGDRGQGYLKYLPEKIFIIDSYARQRAIETGIDSEKLIVAGSPHLEGVCSQGMSRLEEREDLREKYSVSPRRKVILFISEPFSQYCPEGSIDYPGYSEKSVLKDILASLSLSLSEFFILIRLHPAQDPERFQAEVSSELKESEHAYCSGDSASACFDAADVVIGMKSMMLIEAALYGKKVISYQSMTRDKDKFIGNLLGLTIPCYEKEELNACFHFEVDVCRRQDVDRFKRCHAGATNRIVKYLEEAHKCRADS